VFLSVYCDLKSQHCTRDDYGDSNNEYNGINVIPVLSFNGSVHVNAVFVSECSSWVGYVDVSAGCCCV